MASTTTTAIPFILASAFSTNAFDGNPAAIAFVDLANIELSVLQKLSGNFNQPMTSFISTPTSPEPGIVTMDIRYLTASGTEVPLCGHATIAATAAILSLPEFKEASVPVKQVRFKTLTRGWVSVDILEGGWLEIQLPTAEATSLRKEDIEAHASMFRAAFKRDLKIVDIKTGGEKYPYMLMAEIEESENLKDADVDVSAFKHSKYPINGVTSRVTSKSVTKAGEEYVCRMFSPILPGGEDPVCGTLQALLVSYWCQKAGISSGTPIVGLQVSPRGGVIQAVWDESKGITRLRGHGQILLKGECYY
ncbi:hypothetical protein BKA70DRAFT_1177148 [Coprinopsis sp. MPI-PUGE-AT-0042]|nr:hypothetical protein BKA70DRAFT_1177148 [Coprinopsis sp. MPI-PUGE-AT-0042]